MALSFTTVFVFFWLPSLLFQRSFELTRKKDFLRISGARLFTGLTPISVIQPVNNVRSLKDEVSISQLCIISWNLHHCCQKRENVLHVNCSRSVYVNSLCELRPAGRLLTVWFRNETNWKHTVCLCSQVLAWTLEEPGFEPWFGICLEWVCYRINFLGGHGLFVLFVPLNTNQPLVSSKGQIPSV